MVKLELSSDAVRFLKHKYPGVDIFLNDAELLKLKDYPRHKYTNTYDHSVRVAVGAAILAELFKADVESAIRIALLHDMCFVNYYEKNSHGGFYCFYHPVEAADNAQKEFGLSDKECRDIKAHMFPLAIHIPFSKEAWALTLSDKAIAIYEGTYGIRVLRRMLCYIGMRNLRTV